MLTQVQKDRLIALLTKDQKAITPAEKTELTDLVNSEIDALEE